MTINIHVEYVLVNDIVYDNDNERLIDHCFVVDAEWLSHMWNRHLKKLFGYDDLEEFLDVYDPEYEGQIIYMIAEKQNRIIDEGWELAD